MGIKDDNLNSTKVLEKVFFLFLFSLPFDVFSITPMKKIFGELYSCLYVYFVILLFFICVYFQIKIKSSYLLSRYMLLMGSCVFISATVNYYNIINNLFKSRTGLERFFTQLLVVGFMIVGILVVTNVMNVLSQRVGYDVLMYKMYKFFDFMIIFMTVYCIFQYVNYTCFQIPIFNFFDNIIRDSEMPASYYKRIRFVCDEASWFGTYFSVIFPFVLLKLYRCPFKMINWFYLISVSYFAYLTYSRTVYILILIQALVFLIIIYSKLTKYKPLAISLSCFVVCFILILSFSNNTEKNNFNAEKGVIKTITSLYDYQGSSFESSNLARYGMANAAISMGLDNFFGVGLGQYGFNVSRYLKNEYFTWETAIWLSNYENSWPPVHNLYARIFAELGFLGLMIFIIWIIILVIKSLKILPKGNEKYFSGALLSILLLVGFVLIGFNIDSFRVSSLIVSNSFSLFIINQFEHSKELKL